MNENKYEMTLQTITEIVNEWYAQFENPPARFLFFDVTVTGILTLNGVPLAPLSEIVAEETQYDVEVISFLKKDGRAIEVTIDWPNNKEPEIAFISETRLLYIRPCAEGDLAAV